MKIAFFGTPRLAQIVLFKLLESKYKPSLVVTAPDTKSGRGQKTNPSTVKVTAQENNIEVIESLDNLPDFDLAILMAYGKILPKKILAIPKHSFINIHPSLLPQYRGPSPIQSAILEGTETTGITIIKLDEKVDHGPMLASRLIAVEKDDNHQTLTEKLGQLGAELLLEVLPDYLEGKVELEEQDHNEATFTKQIKKTDGQIDIDNPPNAATLDRMIRAYFPWPTVWTKIDGKVFKLLPEGKIQPEGKRPMTIKEFQNGNPTIAKKIKNLLPRQPQ